MALSAMGSAGAWFAGYLKKDERNMNTSQRDRLLDMLTAARQCDSMDELDQMQSEADAILRDTLQCFEHGTIEEGTLDRVQHRDRAVPQRRGRPQGAVDEHAAKPAAGERAIPRGQQRLIRKSGNRTVINSF